MTAQNAPTFKPDPTRAHSATSRELLRTWLSAGFKGDVDGFVDQTSLKRRMYSWLRFGPLIQVQGSLPVVDERKMFVNYPQMASVCPRSALVSPD
jgi:hypothetical protein